MKTTSTLGHVSCKFHEFCARLRGPGKLFSPLFHQQTTVEVDFMGNGLVIQC